MSRAMLIVVAIAMLSVLGCGSDSGTDPEPGDSLLGSWVRTEHLFVRPTDTTQTYYALDTTGTGKLPVNTACMFTADFMTTLLGFSSCYAQQGFPYSLVGDTVYDLVSAEARYTVWFSSGQLVLHYVQVGAGFTIEETYERYEGTFPLPHWPDTLCPP